MNQEHLVVGYDQFFLKPDRERPKIFNEITAENRAVLVKAHAERWLSANRSKHTDEQVAVGEELIQTITPVVQNGPRSRDRTGS